MIYSIDEIKQKIIPIAKKYELPAVYIFGSYARNEATENSDVDFLVDLKGSNVRGWIIGGLYEDLCETFNEKKVDMVSVGALIEDTITPWFAEEVLKERIAIYG